MSNNRKRTPHLCEWTETWQEYQETENDYDDFYIDEERFDLGSAIDEIFEVDNKLYITNYDCCSQIQEIKMCPFCGYKVNET